MDPIESQFPNSVSNFDVPNPTSLPSPPGRRTRCATGFPFLLTIYGIFSFFIVLGFSCVLISAGLADGDYCSEADSNSTLPSSDVKVSAVHTRNAVIFFAVLGLLLILSDIILHVSNLIKRLPEIFDFVFIITMFVFSGILLILGFDFRNQQSFSTFFFTIHLSCCAAAWEQKMRDKFPDGFPRKGAAAAASFWLFFTMIAILINFVLRFLQRPPKGNS